MQTVEKANAKLIETAEKVPSYLLNAIAKRPSLIEVRGLGQTYRRKYEIDGSMLVLKNPKWRSGQKIERVAYNSSSVISLGFWRFKKPYMFFKKGASRCIDFQNDLNAPTFTRSDAEKVFEGGLMEWWKQYKGLRNTNILILLMGVAIVIGFLNLMGVKFG